jgi:microcystin-dependent protein
MSDPYIGEIRMFAGSFAPAGWAFCDGQLMPISENDALFTLIGTTYGGDGQQTFALPNLQSRVPIHAGTGPGGITRALGESGGVESVTLTVQQIPNHTHVATAFDVAGNDASPTGRRWAASADTTVKPYTAPPSDSTLSPQAVGPTGGSQPHDNMMPFLTISFILSLFGIFPTQN